MEFGFSYPELITRKSLPEGEEPWKAGRRKKDLPFVTGGLRLSRRKPIKEEQKKTEAPSTEGPGKVENEGRERGQEQELHLPEINFSSFIASLSTSALMNLGEVLDPVTQKVDKNLPLAKQSIDMFGMLRKRHGAT